MTSRNELQGTFQERHRHFNRRRRITRSGRKMCKLLCRETWQMSNRVRRVYAQFEADLKQIQKED